MNTQHIQFYELQLLLPIQWIKLIVAVVTATQAVWAVLAPVPRSPVAKHLDVKICKKNSTSSWSPLDNHIEIPSLLDRWVKPMIQLETKKDLSMKTLVTSTHAVTPSIMNHSAKTRAKEGAKVAHKSFAQARERNFVNLSMTAIGLLSALAIGIVAWETHSSPSAPAPVPKQQTIHSVQ